MPLSHELKILRERRFERTRVNLRGTALFSDTSVAVKIIDLSYSGARIEFPLHASVYQSRGMTGLRIVDILHLGIVWRWSRGRMAGVEFISPTQLRDAISHLMETRE